MEHLRPATTDQPLREPSPLVQPVLQDDEAEMNADDELLELLNITDVKIDQWPNRRGLHLQFWTTYTDPDVPPAWNLLSEVGRT